MIVQFRPASYSLLLFRRELEFRERSFMRAENSIDLAMIFGDLEKFKESQRTLARMLEPFLRCHEAAVKYWAKEVEPLMRFVQSEQFQTIVQDAASRLRPLSYMTSDWMDCKLGADTRERYEEPPRKSKPIYGFWAGSSRFVK